jgi:hypothetical protein
MICRVPSRSFCTYSSLAIRVDTAIPASHLMDAGRRRSSGKHARDQNQCRQENGITRVFAKKPGMAQRVPSFV